ncbi:hypothetical protein [Streptomyces sp. NPDC054901]
MLHHVARLRLSFGRCPFLRGVVGVLVTGDGGDDEFGLVGVEVLLGLG